MNTVDSCISALLQYANSSDAVFLQRFFKTGPGQYGEGDKFLGIRNPQTRAVAKQYYKQATIKDISTLLSSEWHEVRLCALVMMMLHYKKANLTQQYELYNLYINNIGTAINNWDLVDISSPRIVGAYLSDKDRQPLYDLAKGDLWHKRVSIISTFWFIRSNDFVDAIRLIEILMYENHDLLHKAVGWVMREIGKHDIELLCSILDENSATMPRTTLRYAIEKLSLDKKHYYMTMKQRIS